MPPWFDLLRTPMAAPETVRLRRLRVTWQLLCLLTALTVGFITPLRAAIGQAAPRLAAMLIACLLVQSRIYWAAKQRADSRADGSPEQPE
ncbi:hypothetical protein [Sphingobium baderi]|uniref:hypothetical protein n=1 Tax=Sphingobium baderi TaxID=1332080 RepID=UPI002B40E2C7|nr:hypothetical protein [Sphingobium baderi]WRD78826.1 hypothetical protein QQ987_19295 [Sphingobium baderi]